VGSIVFSPLKKILISSSYRIGYLKKSIGTAGSSSSVTALRHLLLIPLRQACCCLLASSTSASPLVCRPPSRACRHLSPHQACLDLLIEPSPPASSLSLQRARVAVSLLHDHTVTGLSDSFVRSLYPDTRIEWSHITKKNMGRRENTEVLLGSRVLRGGLQQQV
jgi:hypothetical protein